jgi:hypothetical protein
MAHICPVCKARLWKKPLARRLRCPRCGAEFRPTVPLAYFQILFFLFLLVALALTISLSYRYGWVVLLLVALFALIIWFLPRLVRLEIESADLRVAEGPACNEMKIRYRHWADPSERDGEGEEARTGYILYFLAALVICLAALLALQVFF